MRQQFIEGQKSQFSFNVSILTQMSSRMGLLRSKTRSNAIYISQTRQSSFQIQLTALSQIRIFTIIFESKQGTSSFDLSLDHTRRCDFSNMVFGIYFAKCSQDGRTYF